MAFFLRPSGNVYLLDSHSLVHVNGLLFLNVVFNFLCFIDCVIFQDRGSVMAPHRAASPPNEKDRGSVMAPSRAASPPDGKVDECDEWTTMLR
ncbi:hypothetical protein Y032_0002g1056 [Ancylostoma ceylanicum]|uniref:Uncharacterized protein n=1 Tax=Ancylostoma ceylanicum TaxID=53326 RepID=A0A016VZF7_9BILA|nr:hypothetical protein Y032_0002g1056 [Ancylostoma ceylanicum]